VGWRALGVGLVLFSGGAWLVLLRRSSVGLVWPALDALLRCWYCTAVRLAGSVSVLRSDSAEEVPNDSSSSSFEWRACRLRLVVVMVGVL